MRLDDCDREDFPAIGQWTSHAIASGLELRAHEGKLARREVFRAFDLIPAFSGPEEREKVGLQVAGKVPSSILG